MPLSNAIAGCYRQIAGKHIALVGVADRNGHGTGSFESAKQHLGQISPVTPVWSEPDAFLTGRSMLIEKISEADVVYKAVFGPLNRSGFVQSACEVASRPVTGHPLLADVLSQEKVLCKHLGLSLGMNTPKWCLPRTLADLEEAARLFSGSGFVVKPERSNGGNGIWIFDAVTSWDLLREELARIWDRHDSEDGLLVESRVRGRSFTVGTLRISDHFYAIEPLEYISEQISHSTSQGHQARVVSRSAAIDVHPDGVDAMKQGAVAVHRRLTSGALVRVDFVLPNEGVPEFLEVNTNISIHENSDITVAAALSGISLRDLILIQVAGAQHATHR